MLIMSFFQWWFTSGWSQQFKKIESRATSIYDSYSIPILLSTMFKPWKQIVSSRGPTKSLNNYILVMLDNAVSRFVGFWVRFFTLIAASLLLITASLYSIILALIWPLIPALPLILLFLSVEAM